MTSKLDASRNYSYLAIAAFFGFMSFILHPTAYTWGEQDMMPFFERVFDSNYLTSDFFTNSTQSKNPRWVYGYLIVGLSYVTNLDWYDVLYFLKLLVVTLTPILYFKVLLALLGKFVDKKSLSWLSPFVLVCLVLMIFFKEYRYYFSVGSWLSYSSAIHAHKISGILGFLGILLKERNYRLQWYLPFFFLSCLVHPAIGLYVIGFYAIFLIPGYKIELKSFIPILMSAIGAVLTVKLIFAPEQALPVAEFIDIYIKERHPWHYSVPDFGNRKGDWKIFFIGMNTLFLFPFVYGTWQKNRILWKLSLFAWISYSGAIALQYVFIDVIPIKLVAYLGVSRFTIFGYWMLVVIWAVFLSNFIKKDKTFVFPSFNRTTFCVIIINLIIIGIIFIDDPKNSYYINTKDLYTFVKSTPKDAIFIAHSASLNTDLRIIGRRGVFIGDEFPFTEEYMVEYGKRYKMMYGSRQTENNGIDFYRNLSPKDLKEISKTYRLDYILIENGFSDKFKNNIPVWNNHKYSVYSVDNLRF